MKTRLIVALGLFACGGSAVAQPPHKWYAGIDVGEALLDRRSEHSEQIRNADETAFSYSLMAGYRFSRYFALEAGYTDLGEFSASPDPSVDATATSRGFMLNTKVIWPVARHLELEFLAGGFWRYTDLSVSGSVNGASSDHGFASRLGFGASVPINDHFAFEFAWVNYIEFFDFDIQLEPDFEVFSEDVSAYSLGVRWTF